MSEKGRSFQLSSPFAPSGDQPSAIDALVRGVATEKNQVLLGVTGSGKTYTMAQVIQRLQRPALIMAHNKTLAAQLYGEMMSFFPHNAVEYFVSYYDYYQPEAYVPRSDTFIEKETSINEHIDRLRHAATRSLFERDDVILVASVSCIYGIGSVETYSGMVLKLQVGERHVLHTLHKSLVELQYRRNDIAFTRGTFRQQGDILDIFPVHRDDRAWRVSFFGEDIDEITEFDPLTGEHTDGFESISVYPNSHYVTPRPTLYQAMKTIKKELKETVASFEAEEKWLEAQRLSQRTSFDLEMMAATGFCSGIENYSRHLTGRARGTPPPTLFEYLPENALLFVDESHVSVPQIGAMFKGDASRKATLAEHGFRLPSCADNRPLTFEEWDKTRPQTIFVSATPGPWELEKTEGVFVEQVVRPTGLLDPLCEVRPTQHQVDDLLHECRIAIQKEQRVLVTTLTKKMAEDLTDYLLEVSIKACYMHSDTGTVERMEIIQALRLGTFHVLIGINLLREGLDIPECALVAILDADKEGFLRSRVSLVQTIGRAARHKEGRVLLYADRITDSLHYALKETERRRHKQDDYNKEHGIQPMSIKKDITTILHTPKTTERPLPTLPEHMTLGSYVEQLKTQMMEAAEELDFEQAARLRDEIKKLSLLDRAMPAAMAPLSAL